MSIENTGPRIDPKQAVDLSQVGREADERQAREAAELEAKAAEQTRLWLKAMRRTFRGIIGGTEAQRIRNLRLAAQRAEREQS